ncbi:hypothetical protein CDV31_003391 [Fusarium ambrosium]|uniref:Uncharacterized protein n=1 Tax=Fusarium ambrosium TaxID=131363 RepID=A0A428UU27_9HYPO|nr:hypothetical protein CDV31_003391 [Fusarium ambrosium]
MRTQPLLRMPAGGQKHKGEYICMVEGCRNHVAKSSTTGEFYHFCHRHACEAGPSLCGDQTRRGEKYCEKHAECADPDCHVRFEPYHLRYSQIGVNRWFCPEHACTEGGCYKRRRDSVTLFCAAHAKENKCSKRDCEDIRVPDGQLCKKHTCDEPGCLLEVYPQGRNGKMCSEHQPCGFAGCRRPTILDADGHPKTLCAYHHLCRAPGPQCDGIVDGYSDYCQQHKCGVTGCHRCRDNERIPENRWCTPHTCIIEGCQERIDNTNDPNSRHFGSALITSAGDVGASLHDWKDPISARITRAAIEGAGMLPHVQEAVVSSTTVGGTTSLTVIPMIPAAADDTDMTSRDAMLTPVVLDGSALATAVHEERKNNNTKTTGTISLEGEMSGMSALDIVGNDV